LLKIPQKCESFDAANDPHFLLFGFGEHGADFDYLIIIGDSRWSGRVLVPVCNLS